MEKPIMEETVKPKSKNRRFTSIIIIVLLVAGVVIGIVEYIQAQKYESTDDAQIETDISPVISRIQGYIAKINFTDNQHVKKGDTLLTLDDRDLQLKEKQAEAALQNALASLEVAKTNAISSSQESGASVSKTEQLTILLANAQKEAERYKKMYDEHSATEQDYEKKKTDAESLAKQLEATKQQQNESSSKTEAANQQIKVAESMVQQRQSDLDYAKLQLSYAAITAPFDGVVAKKNAVVGQLVQGGQPVCAIINPQNIWITANFKETQIKKMSPGMKVEVEVDALPGKTIGGNIASSSPATGSQFSLIPPDNASGNFVKVVQRIPIRIELNKSDNLFKSLKPGMSVNVKVILE